MIRTLIAAALLAAVLACTPQPGAPLDDMAATKDCTSILSCVKSCATSTCANACVSNASSKGHTEYANALGCDQQVCANAGRCMLDSSSNTFVDAVPGSGDCSICLTNATARLFANGTCQSSSDPQCNPSSCKSATDTCLAD